MEKLKDQLPKKSINLSENKMRQIIRKEINIVNEELEDLNTALPVQITRFLDKAISAIKGYNLNRKKQTLVIAKMIDALGLDKNELMMILSKVKRAGVVQK